jgi:hypothetical protein
MLIQTDVRTRAPFLPSSTLKFYWWREPFFLQLETAISEESHAPHTSTRIRPKTGAIPGFSGIDLQVSSRHYRDPRAYLDIFARPVNGLRVPGTGSPLGNHSRHGEFWRHGVYP